MNDTKKEKTDKTTLTCTGCGSSETELLTGHYIDSGKYFQNCEDCMDKLKI